MRGGADLGLFRSERCGRDGRRKEEVPTAGPRSLVKGERKTQLNHKNAGKMGRWERKTQLKHALVIS